VYKQNPLLAVMEHLVLVAVEVVVVPVVVLVLLVGAPQSDYARWLNLVSTAVVLVLVVATHFVAA
jgi:hypothetical protein